MKKITLIIRILILIIFITIIVNMSFYVYAFITPKFELNSQRNIIFLDKNNNDIFTNIDSDYIKLDDINNNVKNAIISIEDKNFYKHKGFDYLRIVKAMFVNVKSGKIKQGASTISQQYIKNLFLTFDKTWKRKLKEAYLTVELETHYSKDEILEGYLNTIDFAFTNKIVTIELKKLVNTISIKNQVIYQLKKLLYLWEFQKVLTIIIQ